MGILDKVMAEQEKENAAKSRRAAFVAMCGSEDDPIAVDLTEEQQALLQEVIDEVPENMWGTVSHQAKVDSEYWSNINGVYDGKESLRTFGIKYIDPDGNLRLSGNYSERKVWGSPRYIYGGTFFGESLDGMGTMEQRIERLPKIGSQNAIAINANTGYVYSTKFEEPISDIYMLFKDGTFFARGKDIEQFPKEEIFVKAIQLLIAESEKRKRQAEQQERENQQSRDWESQGFCKYCGGKLSVFGKKCKS